MISGAVMIYGQEAWERTRGGLIVRGRPLLGQGAQVVSAPWGHSLELVINELGDVVLVVIFDDAPEFGADEVVVFEVMQ